MKHIILFSLVTGIAATSVSGSTSATTITVSNSATTVSVSNSATTVSVSTTTASAKEEKEITMKGRFILGVILAIFLGCVLFLAVSTIIFTKTEDYRRYGFHQNNHVMNINIYNEAYEERIFDERANINPDDTYDTVSVISFADDTYCSVCIDNFDTTEKDVVKLKNCNHIFHKECIDKWIKINRTCPVCRKDVVNDE